MKKFRKAIALVLCCAMLIPMMMLATEESAIASSNSGNTVTAQAVKAKFLKTFDLSSYTAGQSITEANSNFTNLDNSTISIQADGDEKYVKLSGSNTQARMVMNSASESLSNRYTKIVLDETVRMTKPNLGVTPAVGNTAWQYAWAETAPAACFFNNVFGTGSTVVVAQGKIYAVTKASDNTYASVQELAAFPADTWVRVSLVFDVPSNTADVYIDGEKKTTTPIALTSAALTATDGIYSVPRQYINNLIFNNGSSSFVESKRIYTYALTDNATTILDYATLSGYTNADTGTEITISGGGEVQIIRASNMHIATSLTEAVPFGIWRKGTGRFESLVEDSNGVQWLRLTADLDPYIEITADTDHKKLYEEVEVCWRGYNDQGYNESTINLFAIKGKNGNGGSLLTVGRNGELRMPDGTPFSFLSKGVATTLLVEIDLTESTYNVYKNNSLVAEDVELSGEIDAFDHWRIYFTSSGQTGKFSSLDVGRIVLYAADEPTNVAPLLNGDPIPGLYEYEFPADSVALEQAGDDAVAFNAYGKYAVINGERVSLANSPKLTDDGTYYITKEILEKGFNATVTVSGDTVKVNGTVVDGEVVDGVTYVEIADVCENVLSLNYFVDDEGRETGFGIIGSRDFSDFEENSFNYREINNYTIFKRPKANEILANFNSVGANQHPRVYADDEAFDALLAAFNGNGWKAEKYEEMMALANTRLTAAPINLELVDGLRWQTAQNGNIEKWFTSLIFAYLTTAEGEREKYIERLWEDIQHIASRDDWNPNHFLDHAAATKAFAIAYDWLYDHWNEDQLKFIADTIVEKGLAYAENAAYGKWCYQVDWLEPIDETDEPDGNWTAACEAGMVTGAIAIMDRPEYKERCAKIIETALRHIENMLPTFAPDGAWEEGIGYWNYTCQSLAEMFGSISAAMGTTYGYLDYEPLSQAENFPIYVIGPKGAFAFGDVTSASQINGPFSWLAKVYGHTQHLNYRVKCIEEGLMTPDILDLLHIDNSISGADFTTFDHDMHLGGIDTGAMRSDWTGTNDTWVGYHCGSNLDGHMHYDSGTFEFDAMGVRWIAETGADDYNIPNYAETSYRARAEGNNVYVINPSEDAGQIKETYGQGLVKRGSNLYEGFAIIDITASYADDVTSAKRGYKLTDDRRALVLRDEITMKADKANSDFYSFMHTQAAITVAEDGKAATFTKNGKQMKVEFISNQPDLKLSKMAAEKFATSPYPGGYSSGGVSELDNSSYTKLAVSGKVSGDVTITLKFMPVDGGEYAPIDDTPFAKWNTKELYVTSAKFTNSDGVEIENPVVGSIKFDCNLYSAMAEQRDILIFAGVYEYGILKEVTPIYETIDGGEIKPFSNTVTVTNAQGCSVEYFFFDGAENIKPLSNKIYIKNE